jgi:hypothetical protein
MGRRDSDLSWDLSGYILGGTIEIQVNIRQNTQGPWRELS